MTSCEPNNKGEFMKFMILLALALSMTAVHAKKDCTTKDKKEWMKEADFKKKVEADGYVIEKFKTSGNCYEIYGKNKEGKEVEIYFNPVDGSIAKSK